MEFIIWLTAYIVSGIASYIWWNAKGDTKPNNILYTLLGPFLLPVGAIKWGDTGITLRKSIELFGLAGTLKGTSLVSSPIATLIPLSIFQVVFLLVGRGFIIDGGLSILVGVALIAIGFAVTLMGWRDVVKRIFNRVQSSLNQPLNS